MSSTRLELIDVTELARGDPDLLNSATGAGLLYFCEIMIKRNEMAKATGSALRTGCKKVLETDDDPDGVDLRSLDVDGLLRRFINKNRVDLNDRSLQTYQQRFRQTLEMYLKYLDGEPNWNSVKIRPAGPKPTGASRAVKFEATSGAVSSPSLAASNNHASPATEMIEWPIPIRPGVTGRLIVPDRMSQHETQKVVKVVTALAQAVEEQLALPPGASGS